MQIFEKVKNDQREGKLEIFERRDGDEKKVFFLLRMNEFGANEGEGGKSKGGAREGREERERGERGRLKKETGKTKSKKVKQHSLHPSSSASASPSAA